MRWLSRCRVQLQGPGARLSRGETSRVVKCARVRHVCSVDGRRSTVARWVTAPAMSCRHVNVRVDSLVYLSLHQVHNSSRQHHSLTTFSDIRSTFSLCYRQPQLPSNNISQLGAIKAFTASIDSPATHDLRAYTGHSGDRFDPYDFQGY